MASSSITIEEDMHEERSTDGDANTVNEESPTETEASWSELPKELLSKIATLLGLIDLLSFRGVCNEWRKASSTASAEIQIHEFPWFLCVDSDDKCILWIPISQESFKIDVPYLYGARCLASNQGWLLIFKQGSIFFLCPFSGAKIDLPDFPSQEVDYHAAAFSAPPTSPDCMVCVFNRKELNGFEMFTVRRGENIWSKYEKHDFHLSFGPITCAAYSEGLFFFSDNLNAGVTFSGSEEEESWKFYRIILRPENKIKSKRTPPFISGKDYSKKYQLREKLKIEDNASILICGTLIQLPNHSNLSIDGENVGPLEHPRGQQYQGIWVQPRFFQNACNQNWSL